MSIVRTAQPRKWRDIERKAQTPEACLGPAVTVPPEGVMPVFLGLSNLAWGIRLDADLGQARLVGGRRDDHIVASRSDA